MQSDRHGIDREEIRRVARLAADTGKTPDVSALSQDDVEHLIYEFGVYQNELLAQNEQLEAMRSELEASRNELSGLYEFAPIGYVTVDSEARVVRANLTVCDMLETRRSKLLGYTLLKWIAPEKHHEIRTMLRSTIRNGGGKTLEVSLQSSPDKTPKHLRLDIRPEGDQSTRTEHCLVALTDITKQKKLEAELIEARQTAETHSAAKSTFLANMSHEIRTPMNGILGMVQLLERTVKDPDSQKYLAATRGSAETLLTIISDALDLSKIEAGKLDVKTEPVEVTWLVEGVQKLFEHRSAETSVPLHVDVDENVPPVIVADSNRVRQVLFNLIGNAFKFTDKEGEIRLEVRVREGPEGNDEKVEFTVTDTGIGMTSEFLEVAIQPFVQARADRTDKSEGTGLGLSIVNHLVELMGGTFSLESAPDKGTRATFTIPSHEPEAETDAEAEAPTPIKSPAQADADTDSSSTQAAKRYRLLVAEDNAINSFVMTAMLQRLGHEAYVDS